VRHFHNFIEPGKVSQCHLGKVMWRTENRHGIARSGFEIAEKNYKELWKNFCDFLEYKDAPKPSHVTFFAKRPSTKSRCIEWLASKAGGFNPFGEVLPVEELIGFIYRRLGNPIPSSQIQTFFETLEINKDTKCSYHKSIEAEKKTTYNCTLANVFTLGAMIKKIADTQKSMQDVR